MLTISRLHLEFTALKNARPLVVLTGLAVAIAFVRPGLLARRSVFTTWPAKVVAALAVWACLGAPFGISFGGTALFIVQDFSKTVILVFLIIVSIRTARDVYTIIMAYVVSSAWLIYEAVFKFHTEYSAANGGYYRLNHLTTYDANDVGLVLLFGLALALLIFQTARPTGRVLMGVVVLGITTRSFGGLADGRP